MGHLETKALGSRSHWSFIVFYPFSHNITIPAYYILTNSLKSMESPTHKCYSITIFHLYLDFVAWPRHRKWGDSAGCLPRQAWVSPYPMRVFCNEETPRLKPNKTKQSHLYWPVLDNGMTLSFVTYQVLMTWCILCQQNLPSSTPPYLCPVAEQLVHILE